MDIRVVLVASIGLQLATAALALRLIWLTGRRWAWVLISAALLLMAVRRSVTLAHILDNPALEGGSLGAELIALAISAAMLVGVAMIGPIFAAASRSQAALQESQRALCALMSNLPGMAYRCRNDRDWTMEFVSQGCLALTGYESDELVGNRLISYNDLILPDHRQAVWDEVQRAVEARLPFRIVYRIRSAEGQEKWVWEQGCGVFDAQCRLTAIEGFITDITERQTAEEILRKSRQELEDRVEERTAALSRANERLTDEVAEREQAEAALAESEQRFRSLVEATSDWIWEMDPTGVYTYASPKVFDLLGYDPEEVLGRRPFDFMPQPEAQAAEAALAKAAAQRAPLVRLERPTLRQDGRRVILETSGVPVLDADAQLRGFRGVDRDITKPKQDEVALKQTLEKLEQSNRDLTQFAYSASHDLQEPLRMMGSYLQALEGRLGESLDENSRSLIELSLDATRRMQRLINDLLSYARVGTRGGRFEPLDVNRVVDEAMANLHGAIEASGAAVTRDDLPTVRADATLLTQLFQNLISNGVKFSRDGHLARVHVGSRECDGHWHFSVRDNGIGIAPEYLERVFAVFERLHPQDDYPGTGIGLAICKRVVERHGGRIWCESTKGEGATFHFTLPKEPLGP